MTPIKKTQYKNWYEMLIIEIQDDDVGAVFSSTILNAPTKHRAIEIYKRDFKEESEEHGTDFRIEARKIEQLNYLNYDKTINISNELRDLENTFGEKSSRYYSFMEGDTYKSMPKLSSFLIAKYGVYFDKPQE